MLHISIALNHIISSSFSDVENVHIFSVVVKLIAIHSWQLGKKRIGPSNYAIIHFFGATNPYKKMMNISNKFWKIWFFILTKVTSICPNVRTFGFEG